MISLAERLKRLFGSLIGIASVSLALSQGIQAGVDPSNKFKLGDGLNTANKTIEINKGSLTLNPKIFYNVGSSIFQFTNDGTNIFDLFALPSQTGNAGKFLTTNGTVTSWATVNVSSGYYGRLFYPPNTACGFSTSSSSYADFTANNNCTAPTVDKNVTDPGAKKPEFSINSAPIGDYVVRAYFTHTCPNDNQNCSCRLFDGTTVLGEAAFGEPDNGTKSPRIWTPIEGQIRYNSVASHTIKIQCRTTSGTFTMAFADVASNEQLQFFVDYTQ